MLKNYLVRNLRLASDEARCRGISWSLGIREMKWYKALSTKHL